MKYAVLFLVSIGLLSAAGCHQTLNRRPDHSPYPDYRRTDPYRNDYDHRRTDPYRNDHRRTDPYRNPYDRSVDPYRNPHIRHQRVSKSEIIFDHNRYIRRAECRDLSRIAQEHAEYMARVEKLSHYDAYNRRVDARCRSLRYRCYGENIAYGFHDSDSLMDAWMKSSGHRRNIENRDYTMIGVGIAHSRNGVPYYCVIFGG